jgi:hypothetical protein
VKSFERFGSFMDSLQPHLLKKLEVANIFQPFFIPFPICLPLIHLKHILKVHSSLAFSSAFNFNLIFNLI